MEDDDVWGLEDDKYSLEFTLDQSIRIERFLWYFNRN